MLWLGFKRELIVLYSPGPGYIPSLEDCLSKSLTAFPNDTPDWIS